MNHSVTDPPPILAALREAAAIVREVLDGLPMTTGRRWQRPVRECPVWCSGGHRCTAQHGYTGGEHRSRSATLTATYGRIVASRTEPAGGRTQLDLNIRVTLAPDEATALAQGVNVPLVIDQAIAACLAEVELMARHRDVLAVIGGTSHV